MKFKFVILIFDKNLIYNQKKLKFLENIFWKPVSIDFKILIIYATVGGNTELVVDKISQVLQELAENENKKENKEIESEIDNKKIQLNLKIKRVENVIIDEVLTGDLTILASPTYGQGTVEAHFLPFLKVLEKTDLSAKNLAVVGLGSPKFYPEYLTESASILENSIKKAGGNLLVPSMRIGGDVLKILDKIVPSWTNRLWAKILENLKNPNERIWKLYL